MRVTTSLMTSIGLAAGVAAAVVVYQSAAGISVASPSHSASTHPAPATTTWLPCEKGWKLEGQTCTRIMERVVVVHDRPSGATPSAVSGYSAPRPTWVLASVNAHTPARSGRTTAPTGAHTGSPTPASDSHETEPQQPEPSDGSATPGAPAGGSDN